MLVTHFEKDADETASGIQTPQLLFAENPADIVLFQSRPTTFGTRSTRRRSCGAYDAVLSALRAVNPRVIVLTA